MIRVCIDYKGYVSGCAIWFAVWHINPDIITITNPLKTIEKLTPLIYQKPSEN